MHTHKIFKRGLGVLVALGLAGSVVACSSDDADSDATSSETTTTTSSETSTESSSEEATSDDDVTFEDAYVRAMDADSDMTALFGELHNNTDEDITVTGLTSSVEADSYELHEVVDGVMQVKEGGFVIPANESIVLQPGADHFMFMGVHEPVPAGATVSVTLHLENGEDIQFDDIAVRTIGAGDEDYGDIAEHEDAVEE